MQNLERLMVETGQVIQNRYLLQRLIQQGQACAVYQGTDQVLQRAVAIKIVSAEHIPAYRAALRATSQFSHPNVVGIYDMIIEPEILYVIQEYVEGDNFGSLLQAQLSAYEVADLGTQICQALLYAGSASRKVIHGDLTPAAILRDRFGGVRINNFALPSDLTYFSAWSVIGGDATAVSDQQLPAGQMSDGRRDDDARAVGLLLYQLLTGRTAGATTVEPPADGRLRFLRNVPPELCDVIARAVVRQHPQHINTPDALHAELKALAETLAPPPVPVAAVSRPLRSDSFALPGSVPSQGLGQPGTGRLAPPLPTRDVVQTGTGMHSFRSDTSSQMSPMNPMNGGYPTASPVMTDMAVNLATARQTGYMENPSAQRRVNMPILILVGLVLFALFFVIGYFLAHTLIP